jgi:hypothetical protein
MAHSALRVGAALLHRHAGTSRPAVSVWWQQKRENAKTPRACAGGNAIAPAGLLIRFD